MRRVGSDKNSSGVAAASFNPLGGKNASADHSHQLLENGQTLTLLNGWTTRAGFSPPKIAALGDLIIFEGVMTNAAFNSVIANIPAYFRTSYVPVMYGFYHDALPSNQSSRFSLTVDASWNLISTNGGIVNPVISASLDGCFYVKF